MLLAFAFGLLLVVAGIGLAFGKAKQTLKWLRLRRPGIGANAEIVDRRVASDHKGDAPPAYFFTVRWAWDTGHHSQEFQVPHRWWKLPEGASVPIRIDPDRPNVAMIEHWTANPVWSLLVGALWMVLAALGAVMMGRAATDVCNPVQYDALESACDLLRSLFS